jgi:hypothetical protein
MNFRKNQYSIFLLLFSFCGFQAIFAQNVIVNAKLDTSSIEIGDQIWLNLSVDQGKTDKVLFPVIKDTIVKGIDVIESLPVDTLMIGNNRCRVNKKIKISSYDLKYYVIPRLAFIHLKDTLYTDSLTLVVNPVKLDSLEKASIDTTQAFPLFDIKGPIDTPFTFKEFIQRFYWYIIAFFVLVLLVIIAIIYFKRRSKNQPFIKLPEKPKEPAHLIAIRALDALKAKKLWQTGFEKEYYIELSDIIREYIENRFNIPTFERTSHELLEIIEYQNLIEKQLFGQLNQLLTLSDLAKFAKYRPLPNENDLCLKNSYSFVEQTKQEEILQEEVKESEDEIIPEIGNKV